ncbi:DUF4326 domain-containing protein [Paracraurococcus ruber]|uniref:DUF4326 domain-containing protein n=1 Tax=Paracraurococcus ruber TaxID=77675 RepID=A0ABS1CR21_9PROT|nr:DUF4326 domain-containing protein [Paracraurococcus ruber]MBK1656875.1 hypothetical protein [Paracraurococcus ruber]TDG33989.1 DUF4326 domain-containing protein [Paracraurococcus ruber]
MADLPQRIQRRRTSGWTLPEGAICVDRSTPWGNPFVVSEDGTAADCVALYRRLLGGLVCLTTHATPARQEATLRHVQRHLPELRGRTLACWCRPGQPCHADVLIELANAPLACEAG